MRKQILARWGEEEANNYDPKSNCLTFNRWLENGYRVKKGEKALKSIVVIEKKDRDNKLLGSYVKHINLFYVRQVEKVA